MKPLHSARLTSPRTDASRGAHESRDVFSQALDGLKHAVQSVENEVTRRLEDTKGAIEGAIDHLEQRVPYIPFPVPELLRPYVQEIPLFGRCGASQRVLGATPQQTIDRVYDLLEYVDSAFRRHQVPYFIASGTLLGGVRHGGMIPWDNDADLCVRAEDEDKIRDLRDVLARDGYDLQEESHFGFKITKREYGTEPFVDIFLLASDNRYARPRARDLTWPRDRYPYSAFSDPQEMKFGHLSLLAPKQEEALWALTESYGRGWPTLAYKGMDHDGGILDTIGLGGSPVQVRLTDFRPATHSKVPSDSA